MEETSLEKIWQKIVEYWEESGAWPDFVEVMHRILPINAQPSERDTARRVLLPGLCCQAAGGDFHLADSVAAAWYLLYAAAHIMDSVEDQDLFPPEWGDLGAAGAINLATGLFFSACHFLEELHHFPKTHRVAPALIQDFHNSFLGMCSGQQRDLLQSEPTLQQYWENAAAKSGGFFALACRSGARLATRQARRLKNYSLFGHHFGLLVQILDDLEGFKASNSDFFLKKYADVRRSLPIIYAMEVLPTAARDQLASCLRSASQHPSATEEALHQIEESGAVIYILTEIERHRSLAKQNLVLAEPLSPAGEMLSNLLSSL